MRWIRLNFILLASLAILSVTEAESSRHKRSISYVKNFIKNAIFGRENKTDPPLVLVNSGENYKIFRIPGFNNVLVKAVPKVAGAAAVPEKVELVSPADSKVDIVASYLGTKTQSETLNALQGIKTLFGSGVLTATKDQAVPVGPLPPHLQLIAVGDGTFEKPHILLDTSVICDDVQADENPVVVQQPAVWQRHPFLSIFQRPIPFPTVLKPVNPVKVPVPALPTKYSYKQFHGDGTATTYTANDDKNVIVTQSDQPGPLPPVVTYRIQEVLKLGAHGIQGLATLPVFAGNIQRPLVQYFTSPKVNPYHPVVATVGSNYSYKQTHNDGSVTSYLSGQKDGDVIVTESGKVPAIPVFITERIEKVAATAATGKPPNPVVLSGLNVAQAEWYNPLVYGHQMVDTKGRVVVDAKIPQQTQQNINTGSQGTYSYQMIHKDGSVTNHGADSSISSEPVNAEIKPISPLFIEDRLQTIAKTSDGSFSYKILHNDGSVTNYGVFGVREESNGQSKIVPVQKRKPEIKQQAYFKSENKGKGSQPEIKDTTTAGYTYKRIHSDGSVTSYSSSGVVEEIGKGPVNQLRGDDLKITNNKNVHINLNNQQSAYIDTEQTHDQQGNSAVNYAQNQQALSKSKANDQNNSHVPQIGNPSPGSFTYKAIHSDGSMTIYSQNGVKEINAKQKSTDQNKLQLSVTLGTSKQNKQKFQEIMQNNAVLNNKEQKQNGEVSTQNYAVPVPGSFSYKAIHNDGSATIYSQNGVKEEDVPFINKNQPKNNQYIQESAQNHALNNQADKQNVQVSSHNTVGSGSSSFSYKAIHNDGSTTSYSQNGVKEENVALKRNNQQTSSAVGINHQENSQYIQPNAQDNMAAAVKDQTKKQNVQVSSQPKAVPAPGSFSYKTVHSDGSTTIYSQNEVIKDAAKINENQQSSHYMDLNRQENEKNVYVNVKNIVIPVPGSFSYKAVHNDGSMTIYSQNGVKEEIAALKNDKLLASSAAGINQEINKQFNIELLKNAQNNAGTAINELDLKQDNQVSSQNSSPGTISYKAVHNDGSTTIYSQNGVKEENAPYRNGNPQSSNAQNLNQQINNQNVHVSAQNIVVPVSGPFSYKAVHNDGSMTTYTQSGVNKETNVKESHSVYNLNSNNQDQKPVNDVKVNMNEQHLHTNQHNKNTSSTSSFSYKAVHSDGSETNYSGKGVEEIKAQSHNNSINALSQQFSSNKQDEANEKKNVNMNPQYKTSGSFSYKMIHSDGYMQSESLQQNVQNRGKSSAASFDELKSNEQKTNQIIPSAPELPELSSNDLSATPVSVLVTDSSKVLFTKPVVSSYSYKQINHNSPDQFKVAVNIGDAAVTENQYKVSAQFAASANTDEAITVDTIPNDYVYIPPANVNEPPPIKPLVPKEETSKITENAPSVVVLAPVEVVPCVEKSLSEHPIAVLEEPMKYSYQQRKADGSAIQVESDQSVVSVSISPKKRVRSRGDIPESP